MRFSRRYLVCCASLLTFAALGAPGVVRKAAAGGWVGKMPPGVVTSNSSKRNNIFYVGEPVTFELDAALPVGTKLDRFEVRNYWGELIQAEPIEKGSLPAKISLNAKQPGWYKLYVYGRKAPVKPKSNLDELLDEPAKPKADSSVKEADPLKPTGPPAEELWGDALGGTMFVIFRDDKNFPTLRGPDVPGPSGGVTDQFLRAATGMGPQRHRVQDDKVEETFRALDPDAALDRKWYLPFDPNRHRKLMAAFPDGTKHLDGVRQIVDHFKSDIHYWEPRNEPNFGSGGRDFVEKELKPFYETVKSVDPSLKVMGPGTVAIGPHLHPWLNDFFEAGGAKYIDAFSFHFYNGLNGDLALGRRSLDTLEDLLKRHGADKLERWQTEQGYFACVYGAFQPRLQGRWTMLEMMLFEQYAVPKEQNHLWYDRSHGFWDFPTWFENDDGSLNPAAILMRVFSEEVFGTQFEQRLDFGSLGNKLYIGSTFAGDGKRIVALQSAGSPEGRVELKVTGGKAKTLKCVSAFGVESQLPIDSGSVVVPVPELPVYVEFEPGQSMTVVPQDARENFARANGVTITPSGKAEHPVDPKIDNRTTKINNGELENWYWSMESSAQAWMSNVDQFPATVDIDLGQPRELGEVIIYTGPPWQWQGTLLDYELQIQGKDNEWVTVDHIKLDPQTYKVFTPTTRTSVDSFFSDRWIFEHRLKRVTAQKIRLLVHEVTWGGGATEDVAKAGGQTGPHQIMLREIEVYGPQ